MNTNAETLKLLVDTHNEATKAERERNKELINELVSALELARSDIEYLNRAHPEISGQMVRSEAQAAINAALAKVNT